MYGPDTQKALQRISDYGKPPQTFLDPFLNRRVRPIWYNMLDLSYLDIHTVPPLPDEVSYLLLNHTKICEITKLPPYLTCISLNDTPLERITCPLPPTLIDLRIYNTNIRKLPSPLPRFLIGLHCFNTPLDSLPSLPNYLMELDCGSTNIEHLNLPPNLERLNCDNSQLSSIKEFPKSLKAINLYNTRVTTLPDLPDKVDALCLHSCLRLRPKLQPNDTIGSYMKRLARHNRMQQRRLDRLLNSTQHLSTAV